MSDLSVEGGLQRQAIAEVHLAGAYGVREILDFHFGRYEGGWHFPRLFDFGSVLLGCVVRDALQSLPNQRAALIVINVDDKLWPYLKENLDEYAVTVLVQIEGRIGWELSYSKAHLFDHVIGFDDLQSGIKHFLRCLPPYDAGVASSHLDVRGIDKEYKVSKREAIKSAVRKVLPRSSKVVLIASLHKGEHYQWRLDFVRRNAKVVDVYGGGWPSDLPNYKGKCISKLATLRQYRYALALENQQQNGYITEKLLDCLVAGCYPLYWGAPDVEHIMGNGIVKIVTKASDLQAELPRLGDYWAWNKLLKVERAKILARFDVYHLHMALKETLIGARTELR